MRTSFAIWSFCYIGYMLQGLKEHEMESINKIFVLQQCRLFREKCKFLSLIGGWVKQQGWGEQSIQHTGQSCLQYMLSMALNL